MTQKAPGKSEREGITLMQAFDMFPDDATAEAWFVKLRWPDGIRCPYCAGERIGSPSKHPTMPYHCRACRKFFFCQDGQRDARLQSSAIASGRSLPTSSRRASRVRPA